MIEQRLLFFTVQTLVEVNKSGFLRLPKLFDGVETWKSGKVETSNIHFAWNFPDL